jgi:hypothetical protein
MQDDRKVLRRARLIMLVVLLLLAMQAGLLAWSSQST